MFRNANKSNKWDIIWFDGGHVSDGTWVLKMVSVKLPKNGAKVSCVSGQQVWWKGHMTRGRVAEGKKTGRDRGVTYVHT